RGAAKTAGDPNAVRVRVRPGADPQETVAALRAICTSHPGSVPVFIHVLLPAQEVVVRTRGFGVDAGPDLVAQLDQRFGVGAVTVDHAGRTRFRAADRRAGDPRRRAAGPRRSGPARRDPQARGPAAAPPPEGLLEPHRLADDADGPSSPATAHT